ncbi:MAG: protease HtpX [Ghiorsea sp.]|nr:protease HtpX [Ghiorsea sp.]
MKSFKGIGLLIITNILIMVTLAISANIVVYYVLPAFGIDVRGSFEARQLIFAAVFGFGGAFISLWMSKWFAKRGNKMQQVVNPTTAKEKLVYETVEALAHREGIKMPEVWVYWDDVPNAFATGPSRNNSMVAVSSGLASHLTDAELKAVLAHEVGHIANGDMVATTLLQGLMNTMVYFAASMIARFVSNMVAKDGEEPSHLVYFIVDIILQILLSILASIVIFAFSRKREFKADAYAADALGADSMISALQKIDALSRQSVEWEHRESREDALATMKIYGAHGGMKGLFATHPTIEDRIAALRNRR